MNEPIRIALIGAGMIADGHAFAEPRRLNILCEAICRSAAVSAKAEVVE